MKDHMKSLTDLFKIIELTRSMPQYGYALSGIKQDDLSNLAEHHYLVTFIAWQLGRLVQRSGGEIDLAKVLEFALIHDLGELFGGDIAMPYAKVNPAAREKAKAFEAENHKFLAKFFSDDQEHFAQLSEEVLDAKSDEALIAKIADYIEVTQYRFYMEKISNADFQLVAPKIREKIEKMRDEKSKSALLRFVSDWEDNMPGDDTLTIISNA
jgi:5'-deoxynucleotidase YfbR-like HD superfamily hydrolase